MTQANRTNTAVTMVTGAAQRACPGPLAGQVCPSVCPSYWDKRETPIASCCHLTTCDGRQKPERRGQDSNLRRTYRPHGFSKPALSATQPPLLPY